MPARPITLLSDYGHEDEFAGVCRAVIARIAPEASVIDLTHGIGRHDVAAGAAVLARALPYAPPGIHVAIVDPGVGTPRRAVALCVRADDRVLVGPDNGLLAAAAERFGGVVAAADVSESRFSLEPASASFHGRDVFAPVAAHLALRAPLEEAGEAISPESLASVEATEPRFEDPGVIAHVVLVDRFGNAALDLTHEHLPLTGLELGRPLEVRTGDWSGEAVFARTFADLPGDDLLLYEDSYRSLALAVNRGDAARKLGLRHGDEVALIPR